MGIDVWAGMALNEKEMNILCSRTTLSIAQLSGIQKDMAAWNRLSYGTAMQLISHGIPLAEEVGIDKFRALSMGENVIDFREGVKALKSIAKKWERKTEKEGGQK